MFGGSIGTSLGNRLQALGTIWETLGNELQTVNFDSLPALYALVANGEGTAVYKDST